MEVVFLEDPDDPLVEDIIQFFNHERGIERSKRQWLWEFARAPGGGLHGFIALEGGKIAGIELLIPINLSYRGKTYLSAKSEDSQVANEFRGKGVYRKIYGRVDEIARDRGIKAIWGYTKEFRLYQRLGFEVPFALQTYVWNYRGPGMIGIAAGAWQATAGSFFKLGRCAVPRPVHPDEYGGLGDLEYRDVIDLAKDETFLRWRISDHPYSRHEVYEGDGGEYVVVGYNDEANILELAALKISGKKAALRILRGILRSYPGYTVMVRTTLGHPVHGDLVSAVRACGFLPIPTPKPSGFVVKLYGSEFSIKDFAANGLWTEGKITPRGERAIRAPKST